MRTTRQTYIDSNFEAARSQGCDCLQLKLDGWWSRTVIEKGHAKVYSRTQRELPNFAFETYPDITCTLVGELMHGTNWAQDPKILGKTFVFDVWSIDEVDLSEATYKDRYALLSALVKRLPPNFIKVLNFNILDYPAIWQRFVANGDYEGVVFRYSRGRIETPIYRQKNVVVSIETAAGFEEGEGKFTGMLGAVVCESGARVGGGWDNDERFDIWTNQDKYRGKQFECEGRKKFEATGLLRHPNFVKWL